MKLCTTTGGLESYTSSAAEAVRCFEGTGFQLLDFNFYRVRQNGSPFLSEEWEKWVQSICAAADRLGVSFVQAHSPDGNCMAGPEEREQLIFATNRCIHACALMGIQNLVVHPGTAEGVGYDQFLTENSAYFQALYPAMEEYGVNVLIENSAERNMPNRPFFFTGQEMKAFLDDMNHPLLHACWDTGHANMRGMDQYEGMTVLGEHLRAVHIQDNMGTEDEHLAPMMGTCDMDEILTALLDMGFSGPFTFEADNLLLKGGGWPHRRKVWREGGKLQSPSLELARKSIGLLYEIGKFLLSAYDCYEY